MIKQVFYFIFSAWLSFACSDMFAEPVFTPVMPQELIAKSQHHHRRGRRGHRGHRGPRGRVGGTGATGATGATGTADPRGQTVPFSTALAVVPNYDFSFYPSDSQNLPDQFDPTTTIPVPPIYTSTFLVPTDGTISNLTARLDISSTATASPSFIFTVYGSSSPIGTPVPLGSWTATTLTLSTGTLSISPGSPLTATFQNTINTALVTAGTMLTVVISPSGFNTFDIQPAAFSASFNYTPS